MILLDEVVKYYPGDKKPALDHISLNIQPKEFVFLVGKSGAGKSTLIKMLTREEVPTSGKIMVGGIDYEYMRKRHIPHLRRRLGVVFQDFKLLPNRTVYENVAFALEIVGVSNREIKRTVPKVLELVGLADKGHKFPSELSGGERQRVAIARSMARQPKILIADEPTGNLDPETSWGIVNLLEQINDFGTTILVTTHDEKIVNQLKRRVVTIKGGKVVSDQKESGHYNLDATRQVEKRPLSGAGSVRPSMEQIRRATNENIVTDYSDGAAILAQKRAEMAMRRALAEERARERIRIREEAQQMVEEVAPDMNRFQVDAEEAHKAKQEMDARQVALKEAEKAKRLAAKKAAAEAKAEAAKTTKKKIRIIQ